MPGLLSASVSPSAFTTLIRRRTIKGNLTSFTVNAAHYSQSERKESLGYKQNKQKNRAEPRHFEKPPQFNRSLRMMGKRTFFPTLSNVKGRASLSNSLNTVKTKQNKNLFSLKRKKILPSSRIKQNRISLGISRMFCLLALKTLLILLFLESFNLWPLGSRGKRYFRK